MERGGSRNRSGWRGRGRGRGQASKPQASQSASAQKLPLLSAPLCSRDHIDASYIPSNKRMPRPSELDNPKNALSNWAVKRGCEIPPIKKVLGMIEGRQMWRATVRPHPDLDIIAQGDATTSKEAEKLAALSAILQIACAPEIPDPTEVIENTLSDGTTVDFDKARLFLEFYCHRYKFPQPEVTYSPTSIGKLSLWTAAMNIADSRLGQGTAKSKQDAKQNCYVDVAVYLEKCDSRLWEEFKIRKKQLSLPTISLDFSASLENKINDSTDSIRRSTLWSRAPNSTNATPAAKSFPQATNSLLWSRERLASKSASMQERYNLFSINPATHEIREARARLPVSAHSDDILKALDDNDVVVCRAATGSGKTTQLPQIILDAYIQEGRGAECNVICTQPRRLAAISVAERVAYERGQSIGDQVGYAVRFEKRPPALNGSMTFCTVGTFLNWVGLQHAGSRIPSVDLATHIIIDEVHERDLDTDLLLYVIKQLLANRKDKPLPKIILLSATIDPTIFQQYFEPVCHKPVPLIDIPGRQFPVSRHYLEDLLPELAQYPNDARWVFSDPEVTDFIRQEGCEDALALHGISLPPSLKTRSPSLDDFDITLPHRLVALSIAHVLRQSDSGHVLVFLPGWEEIQALQRILLDADSKLLGCDFGNSSIFNIHILHSTVPLAEQQKVFSPPEPGVRRIILSTNIGETSVTIPDVVYVVDTAVVKQVHYNPQLRMSSLVLDWISQSNMGQRAGRAGRHRSGEYFGLLSRQRADSLPTHQTVEMQRSDLSNIIMRIKNLHLFGASAEDVLARLIEAPQTNMVDGAMEKLQLVGALDNNRDLTALGTILMRLPMDVYLGRILLYGALFRCLEPAVTMAALLSDRDPFLYPKDDVGKEEARAARERFSRPELRSDVLCSYYAYMEWEKLYLLGRGREAYAFVRDNYLYGPRMHKILTLKNALFDAIHEAGILSALSPGQVTERPAKNMRHPAFNINRDSIPLLSTLLAISAQPNFAVRMDKKAMQSAVDKTILMPSSSTAYRKPASTSQGEPVERAIYAFQSKQRNMTSAHPVTVASQITRLDPLPYILFGAKSLRPWASGIVSDDWLTIMGPRSALDDVVCLKVMLEGSLLRVYEGLHHLQAGRPREPRVLFRSHETEEQVEEGAPSSQDLALSAGEMSELDNMLKGVVQILDQFHAEHTATVGTASSAPGTPYTMPSTPMGPSPMMRTLKLPALGPGASRHSGRNSPYYLSRPSTPSGLSRESWLR